MTWTRSKLGWTLAGVYLVLAVGVTIVAQIMFCSDTAPWADALSCGLVKMLPGIPWSILLSILGLPLAWLDLHAVVRWYSLAVVVVSIACNAFIIYLVGMWLGRAAR